LARFAALLLALLAATQAPVAFARDHLTIGIGQFPSDLHPTAGDSMAAKSYVLGLTQRPLTTYDPSWQLVCLLCTELPTFENGKAVKEPQPDGSMGVALTYTLQPGARWGDGVPVTTKDVLFTLEVGRDSQSGLANAEMYRRIPRIDAVDDKTFVVHETKLTYDYNALGDFHILPEHLERPVFAKDPATYRNRTVFDTDPTNPGLAFGPYRIASVTPGSRIDLDRNPTWWGDPPAFDHITLKGIENTAALEANLLSGEIDMIEGSVGLSLEQALAIEKRNGDRFKVAYKPGLVFEHIDPNLDNPILADVRVRQALMYGSDRAAIDKRLFGGRQPPAATFVSPLDWVYAADLPPYPFDPKRAAALLEEAGWKPRPDGTRVDAQGHPLRLELATTAGNRTRELVQQVLQSQWRQLGIDVTLKAEPPRVFFGETVQHRTYPGLALFAWISAPENVPRTILHSAEIPTAGNGWAGQNDSGYRNPKVDALLDAIEVELDKEKRRAMWHELQAIYLQDLPNLPLFHRSEAHVWPKWLEGIEPTGQLAPVTLWVERWRVTGGG
jgi:peptide/nickel transport system substrate-binding protein